MVPTIRYQIKAAFSTVANEVILQTPGQTALLRLDAEHHVRLAVLKSDETAAGQCLFAYAWDADAVMLEVNGVVYWRAPVPLLHDDCLTVRATTASGASVSRSFHIAVVAEEASNHRTACTDDGSRCEGHNDCSSPPQSHADVVTARFPVEAPQASPPPHTPRAALTGTPAPQENTKAQTQALWQNYYWFHYNVAPDALGLATSESLTTASPTPFIPGSRSVAEWAIEALLQRHRSLTTPSDDVTSCNCSGAKASDEPRRREDIAPPCLLVSHFIVDDPVKAATNAMTRATPEGAAASNVASTVCCGVCPLQRKVRRQQVGSGAGELSDAEVATGHIISRLRTLAMEDGPSLPPLPATHSNSEASPHDGTEEPHSRQADGPTEGQPQTNRPTAMVSPWDAYVAERARIASEREQQAVERDRKRLEKNGISADPVTTDGTTNETHSEVERMIRRISQLEYILNGPYYVS